MWEKLYSSVVNVLDINQATLSGCVDIICVRHREVVGGEMTIGQTGVSTPDVKSELSDNERWVYRSTPFHVRFGKTKLLKSREKTVSIYVNGELSTLTMKLGAAGEAFFGEETSETVGDPGKSRSGASFSYDASEASDYTDEADEFAEARGIIDYGYYACSNGPRSSGSEMWEKRSSHGEDSAKRTVSSGLAQPVNPPSSGARTPIKDFANPHKVCSLSQTQSGAVTPRSEGQKCSAESPVDADASHQWSWNEIRMKQGDKAEKDDQLLEFSLCGHLLTAHDEELNKQFFQANIVDWVRLNDDPSLWYHSSLVARFDSKPPYYPSKIALPLLASWIVFNKPLSGEAIRSLLRTNIVTNHKMTSTHSGRSSGRGRRPTSPKKMGKNRILKRYRLAIRPTSEQLASLNLKVGVNHIKFTVNSPLQGTKSVTATLYLWPSDAKIVISDVDGTITKSDALGHIMPIFGRDWSHTGVAELFTKIRDNGYYVVYLTARAIGQAEYTREYLFGLTQKDKDKLPRGPLFLSPDRLLPSFKREVISRSAYMFKIPALRDIRNLFPPDHNPFYAGFGNNESDHRAYVSVGIPENRVFIINSSGIISHVNTSYAKTYESMSEIATHMFPPCDPFVSTRSRD